VFLALQDLMAFATEMAEKAGKNISMAVRG
jgi:hypothetical protein